VADNVVANPGTGGATFATDDIGGVHYPISKMAFGALDSATLVSSANPYPVTDAALTAKFAALQSTVPDNTIAAPPVRMVGEDIWTCSFANVIAAGIDSTYFTERTIGTGVGRSQSGGNLLITTGTTTNAEYLARSNVSWRGSWLARYKFIASQRIANQNFAILLADKIGEGLSCTINSATSIRVALTGHGYTSANVGQFMMVGGITGAAGVPGRYAIASIPDANTINFTVAGWPASGTCTVDLFGHSYVRNLYTGTTATNSAFDTQRKGWANGDTTATINTTASPGHLAQMHNEGRNVYLADMLVASATTPNVTTRASKHENIPDDNIDLYVYLWSYNGTVAPASTTTWTVGFVSVEKFANLPVYVQGQRMQGTPAPAPVQITSGTISTLPALAAGTNAVGDVGVQYRASATGAATPFSLLSPATPAATAVKASAGRLVGFILNNAAASVRSVKFWNTAVAGVTMGTTAALFEVDLAPTSTIHVVFEGGISFATAITTAVTGGKGLTDNTAVTLNDVSGVLLYA